MAHMIQTKGGLVTVHSERDVIDAVAEQMGHEFATLMGNYLNDWDYEAMLAKERAQTDEEAVMEENSSLRSQMWEIISMLEQWQEMLEGRLNKSKLMTQMVNLERNIKAEL